jgi:hypothetical protein
MTEEMRRLPMETFANCDFHFANAVAIHRVAALARGAVIKFNL